MTPEDVKRFETLQDFFLHPGWKLLEEELQDNISTLKESLVTSASEAWTNVLRGRIIMMKDLMGYPTLVDKQLEDVKANSV